MRTKTIIPRETEKCYVASTKNTYMFYVPKSASKQAIAKMIADEYKVTVVDVRVALRKGKPTRFSRGKHAYPGTTNRADQKVAFIKVKSGDKIHIFEEPEAPKAEEKKAEKKAEKPAKKPAAKKTTKKEEK